MMTTMVDQYSSYLFITNTATAIIRDDDDSVTVAYTLFLDIVNVQTEKFLMTITRKLRNCDFVIIRYRIVKNDDQ